MKGLIEEQDTTVDEEYLQAISRVVLTATFTTISGIVWYWQQNEGLSATTIGCGLYLIFGIGWLFIVKYKPGKYLSRRITVILGDLGMITFALYTAEGVGASFYAVYLWVIMGNGMRYGISYLHAVAHDHPQIDGIKAGANALGCIQGKGDHPQVSQNYGYPA